MGAMRWLTIAALAAVALVLLLGAAWMLQGDEPSAPHGGDRAVTRSDPPALPAAGSLASNPATGLERTDLTSPAATDGVSGAPPAREFELSGVVSVVTPGWTNSISFGAWFEQELEGTLVVCDAQGRFRIRLPGPDVVTTLIFQSHFRVVRAAGCETADDQLLRALGARKDVRIELELLPHATFLLLLAPERRPLGGQACTFMITHPQTGSSSHGAHSDAEGLLRLPLDSFTEATRVDLWIESYPGGSSQSQSFDAAALRANPGPHEVLLQPGASVPFFAHGPDGRPVAGAQAHLWGAVGEASGADGYGSYPDAIPHAEQVLFRAPGHGDRRVTVPDPPPGMLDVLLLPATTLTVRMRDWHREIPHAYRVDVRFQHEGAVSALPPEEHAFGKTRHGFLRVGRHARPYGAVDQELTFAEDGRVVLDGIRTDLTAEVTVQIAGFVLHRELVACSLDGGAREVVADGRFRARTVRGRVIDEDGAPLPAAQVFFGERRAWFLSATTDATGRFSFGPLPADADFPLWSEPEGHCSAADVARAATAEEEIVLTCARARRVEVQVMRADGRPHVTVDGARIPISPEVLLPDGSTVHPEHGAAAHAWLFPSLPPGLLTFRLSTPEARGEILHDTREPIAILTLRP